MASSAINYPQHHFIYAQTSWRLDLAIAVVSQCLLGQQRFKTDMCDWPYMDMCVRHVRIISASRARVKTGGICSGIRANLSLDQGRRTLVLFVQALRA